MPQHMDGSVVFARWRQCAPPSYTCFTVPTRMHISNGISISLAIFCTVLSRESLYFTVGCPFSHSKLPLCPGGNLDPHLMHDSLGPLESTSQMASHLVQPFLQGSEIVTD